MRNAALASAEKPSAEALKLLFVSFIPTSNRLVKPMAKGSDDSLIVTKSLDSWSRLKRHEQQDGKIIIQPAVKESWHVPIEISWVGYDSRKFINVVEQGLNSWRVRSMLRMVSATSQDVIHA